MSSDHAPDAPLPPARSPRQAEGGGRRILLLAFLALLAGGIGGVLRYWFQPQAPPATSLPARHQPPDPRLLYKGPFTNIHPDVAYVGDRACTPCHEDIAVSYRRHPMGRSLQPIGSLAGQEVYDRAHNSPFETLGVHFSIDCRGSEVWHREKFADVPGQPPITLELPVHVAIGSGTHGRSYLSIRNGYLFQTPISWFGSQQRWNLSPGFGQELLLGRPVGAACLFCHANRVNHQPGTRNHFTTPIFQGHAIGCERCHGPGGRHVETAGKWDIVNPLATQGERYVLPPDLRDAVCEQCHLEGEERVLRRGREVFDFRPGLPLEEFWTVFVAGEEHGQAVSHVEQMHESRCYQATKGDDKLGCTCCHDPHVYVPPAEQARYYRGRCHKCHQSMPCSLEEAARRRQQPEDSCIACHMPRFRATDIVHNASTNHRIPRSAERQPKYAPQQPFTAATLKPFYQERADQNADLPRDLGIAIVRSMTRRRAPQPPRDQDPLALLELALPNDPRDIQAWTSKGEFLQTMQQWNKALASFQTALQINPQEESALRGAAEAAYQMGQIEDSLAYWRRLIAVNPELALYRGNYALLLGEVQRWDDVRIQCQAWLRLEPNNAAARRLWIGCLLQEGNKEEARREFARLAALKPPDLAELRARFEKEMR